MSAMAGHVLVGVVLGAFTFLLFLVGERAVPPALRLRLGHRLAARAGIPLADIMRTWGSVLDRIFGTDAFSLRFIGAALLFSLLSFALFFAAHLIRMPVFADSLMGDGYQRHAVGGQLLTMFVPMNVFITYLGLAYCRDVVLQIERSGKPAHLPLLLARDLFMKVAIVLLAMGLVYLALTPRGSFSGPGAALLAVPGVFWGALRFQNLNCVYIYSSIVSSLWLWAVLLAWAGNGALLRGLGTLLPVGRHPVRALGLAAAVLMAVFYWLIVLLT